MVSQTIDRLKLKEFDRQVGAMFGLAKGALYCVLITLFAVTLLGDQVRQTVVQSTSGRYIAQVLDRSESIIPAEIQEVVGPYLEKLDQQLQQSPGLEDGLAPWLNQVTENASQSIQSVGNAARESSSPRRPWSNATPSFETPIYSAGSSSPTVVRPAERPWTSVYSPASNR